jgi:hypothetical protein
MSDEKTMFIEDEGKMRENTRRRMIFIMNALDDGWTVKKINNSFMFSKKHLGRKEIFLDSYLEKFIESNMREK